MFKYLILELINKKTYFKLFIELYHVLQLYSHLYLHLSSTFKIV